MNPTLEQLHSYPFQKLTALFSDITPVADTTPIALHIGEPRHPTPSFIRQTLSSHLDGLAHYPTTLGNAELRNAIADWLRQRYGLPPLDVSTEVLPINGSREALFAFAQATINRQRPQPVVVMPNPFYQIYEGAALLAGAEPHYLNMLPENGFALDFGQLPTTVWGRTQLVYVCSPNNPTGRVMTLDEWRELFDLSDRHGFVIAADECYSEIYCDETQPPLGALQAAQQCGRSGYPQLVVFGSLSKRSNVPGMRSGFAAGNAALLKKFLLYRTYHGSAMSPPVQAASAAAWRDEAHVAENRRLYRAKFSVAKEILGAVATVAIPEAAFYLWLHTPCEDTTFAHDLYQQQLVSVLPGSYLARPAHGVNPGHNFVRIALVAERVECEQALLRIRSFISQL